MMNEQNRIDKEKKLSSGKLVWYIMGGASAVFAFFSVMAFFMMWLPMKQFISDEPWPIEYIERSKEKEEQVAEKLAAFFADTVGIIDTVAFDEDEVNHLLRINEAIEKYGAEYRVTMKDSVFNVKCTVPAKVIKNQMVSLVRFINIEGYVNAELEGYLRLRKQKLSFITVDSQMNGYPAPFALLGNRTHVDLANYFGNRYEYNKKRSMLQDVKIQNGILYLIKK
jgi:hypothetical protein